MEQVCKVCGLPVAPSKQDWPKRVYIHDVTLGRLAGRCLAKGVPVTHLVVLRERNDQTNPAPVRRTA